MSVAIRQTTVTPDEDGTVVQLHISDAWPEDADASFVLRLTATLGKQRDEPLLIDAQRLALKEAIEQMDRILQGLERQRSRIQIQQRPS